PYTTLFRSPRAATARRSPSARPTTCRRRAAGRRVRTGLRARPPRSTCPRPGGPTPRSPRQSWLHHDLARRRLQRGQVRECRRTHEGRPRGAGAPFEESAAQSEATAFASADFLLAAWLAWMTPFEAALSSFLLATVSAVAAASLSPEATDSRTLRIEVLRSDFTALLRRRAFSLVRLRLI